MVTSNQTREGETEKVEGKLKDECKMQVVERSWWTDRSCYMDWNCTSVFCQKLLFPFCSSLNVYHIEKCFKWKFKGVTRSVFHIVQYLYALSRFWQIL